MSPRKPSRNFEWSDAVQPLIEKYGGRNHPLEYRNRYQLVVMVLLAAQDTDKHINEVSPDFFKAFPSMKELSKAQPEQLYKYIETVRNFVNKTRWLVSLAREVGEDGRIPTTLGELTNLSGIGRKSANVILRESKLDPEGIIVDLHLLRVAPRLGVASGTNPDKIEKQLMRVIPRKDWGEVGMAFSFLGREVCRPTNPNCQSCVMNKFCAYYRSMKK